VGRTMLAIVHRQYGTPDRLTFEEVARPLPGDEEETLGANVSTFRPGDEVFGDAVMGAFAEYVVVPARLIALKPRNLSFDEAAATPWAVAAVQALRATFRVACVWP